MRQLFISRVDSFFSFFLFLWRSGVFQKGSLDFPFDYFLLHTFGVQTRVPTRNAGEARTRLSSGAGGGRRRRAPDPRAAGGADGPRSARGGGGGDGARGADGGGGGVRTCPWNLAFFDLNSLKHTSIAHS